MNSASDGRNVPLEKDITDTKSFDFKASELFLDIASANVVVERHTRPGMHVEVTGPSDLVKKVVMRESGSRLSIREKSSSHNSYGSSIVIDGDVFASFGGNVFIQGGNIRGGVFTSGSNSRNVVTVKVLAPEGTPVEVISQSGTVNINDIGGPLSAGIEGSGKVSASLVTGSLQAFIKGSGDIIVARADVKTLGVSVTGSGDVRVKRGNVNELDVRIAGSGDVRFGGTAQRAILSVAGSGDIAVDHVIEQPTKKVAGSGSIRVKKVGA